MSLSKLQKGEGDSLRASFKEGLGKLLQISTREQANKELKTLIVQNKTTINLRLWLSVLSENRNRHAESQINIIGFIVQQYGKGLLDPLDKIPSLEKTVFRITELLIKLYFKDENINVSIALQKVWNEIYLSAVCDQEAPMKKRLLYDCLEAILNGGADRLSQCTAQVVMEGVLQTSLNREDLQFFKEIAKRTLVLFLKTTIGHPAVLTCLQTVLGYFSIINLLPLLDNIVNKVLSYIPLAPPNSVGYKIKAEASNCLALIGEQLDQNGVAVQQKVIKALQNLAIDKIWAVQVTGRKALNIWKAKVKEWSKQYNSKQQQYFPTAQQFYQPQEQEEQVEPKRPMTAQNFRPRQEVNKQQKSYYEPRMPDFSQGGFLHKNTGIGGGNTAQSAQFYHQRQKPQKTYNRKMQQIKKSIYKPKQDYTQYDETIPWNEGQNLPVPQQNRVKPQPQMQTKSSFLIQNNNLTEDETQYIQGWEKVMELFQSGKKQESAKTILELDDDIYFLRFMLKYGKGLLASLTRPTAAKILKKMLAINKTHFMQQLLLKMVAQTAKSSTGHLLNNQQILSIEEALTKCSKISGLQKPVLKVKQAFDRSLQN